jgi:hypothetical protein
MEARRGPLTAAAVIAALLTPVVIALFLVLDAKEGTDVEFREVALPFSGLVITMTALMICFAIYQWDIRKNPALSPGQRNAWSLGMFALPFSILAYWWLHVRPR